MTKSTSRTLVLAKVESSFNVDASPSPLTDAYLVSEADVRVDATILERNNVRQSLSKTPVAIGRKLCTVTFTHEIKASGTVGTVSKIGSLLRACGYAQTTIADTIAGTVAQHGGTQTPMKLDGNGGTGPTLSALTASAKATSRFDFYDIFVCKAGASTVAKVQIVGLPMFEGDTSVLNAVEYGDPDGLSVTAAGTITANVSDYEAPVITIGGTWAEGDVAAVSVGGVVFRHTVPGGGTATTAIATALAALIAADGRFTGTTASTSTIPITFAGGAAPVTVTSGSTSLTLGNSGAALTITWTGSLVAGEFYRVFLRRPGVQYTPISANFESITLYVYFDGVFHKVTGAQGNFSLNAEAGQYGTMAFTFQGQYHDVIDLDLPANVNYEQSIPPQVELMELTFGSQRQICAQALSIDQNNELTPRDCVSGEDGYNGVRMTGRSPSGGVNPEVVNESVFPYWKKLSTAKTFKFHAKIGTVAGNKVHIYAPAVQFSQLNYTDRNGIRAYDAALRFSALSGAGDDELRFEFA